MIFKLVLVCGVLVAYPLARFIYMTVSNGITTWNKGSQFQVSDNVNSVYVNLNATRQNDSTSKEEFNIHFDPSFGNFPDPALRRKVYERCVSKIDDSLSFKKAWRYLSASFNTKSGDSYFTYEERQELNEYFATKFRKF